MAALALLALDFVLFPDVVEDRIILNEVAANRFLTGDIMTIGKYRLHTLRASSGRIADENYVRKLGSRVNGLAITAFSATDSKPVGISMIAESVRAILPPPEAQRMVALIQNNPTFPIGKVQVLRLQRPTSPGPLVETDVILILRTKRGSDREAKEALRLGLIEVLKEAGKQSVSGLLLPALTVAPKERDSPTFDDFFRFLFEAMRNSKSPPLIDISFFDGWSTMTLEAATAALNDHWYIQRQDQPQFVAALHRLQYRLLLIGLSICFIVSSRHMTLGLKSACVVGTAYTLSLLGSYKTVETITDGLDDHVKTIASVGVMLVLAIGFPHIVSWSVKDLFSEGEKDGGG